MSAGRAVETEEVDAAEWVALEQAMAMAGATGNTTGAGNATGAGGAAAHSRAAGCKCYVALARWAFRTDPSGCRG